MQSSVSSLAALFESASELEGAQSQDSLEMFEKEANEDVDSDASDTFATLENRFGLGNCYSLCFNSQ